MAASRTAQYVAMYRALETVQRRRPPLFQDALAVRFLSPRLAGLVRLARWPVANAILTRYADHRAPGARTSAIARTKVIDDVVRDAVAGGTGQLVILGAGFDCRAHRLPELAATTVFEVDRPETQAEKRERLADLGGDVRYVPVDFFRDDVAAELARAGWNRAEPACFIWEGVTNYLTAAAVEHTLGWIGGAAPKSTLVFTYIHGGLLDGSVSFAGGAKMIGNVRALGEPWTFGLHPHEVEPLLHRFNLNLREDVGADDYRRGTGLPATGYSFYRLAIAEISRCGSRAR